MARGRTNEQSGDMFYVAIKGLKKNEEVRFEIKKAGAAKDAPPEIEHNLSGILTGAEHRIWEYQNVPTDSIVLYLKDPQAGANCEIYKIEAGMSGLTRGLINSLLSAKSFVNQPLFLSVYTNKKGYASLSVSLGADSGGGPLRLDWKYDLDFLSSKVTKDKVKQKNAQGKVEEVEQNNYLELNDFLINEFKTVVVPLVKAGKPSGQSADQGEWPAGGDGPKDDAPEASPIDDLPF